MLSKKFLLIMHFYSCELASYFGAAHRMKGDVAFFNLNLNELDSNLRRLV